MFKYLSTILTKRSILSVVFFLSLFPIYSRGIWELVFDRIKLIPYMMQFISTLISVTIIIVLNTNHIKKKVKKDVTFWIFITFLLVEIVSALLTLHIVMYIQEVIVFCFITTFLLSLFLLGSLFDIDDKRRFNNFVRIIFFLGLLNLIAALLEQLAGVFNLVSLKDYSRIYLFSPIFNSGGFFMPNNLNIIRPTGLTGSFLHFPIIMPLLGAIVFRFEKFRPFKFTGIIFIIMPFLSMSRSGMVISSIILIALTVQGIRFIFNFISQDLRKQRPFLIAGGITMIAVITASIISPLNKIINLIWFRITDIFDIANTSRYKIWGSHITSFLKSNIFFGEFTGYSTNIVANILGYNRLEARHVFMGGVPESSLLSLLVSYGLIGAVLFYTIFIFQIIKLLKKREYLLGFALLGAVVQTVFYQSIEVLPFMFTLALIPLMANSSPNKDEIPTQARIS